MKTTTNKSFPVLITENSILILKGSNRLIAHSNHPCYSEILKKVRAGNFNNIEYLFKLKDRVEKVFNVYIKNNQIFYKKQPIHNVISDKIVQFITQGLPHKPLTRFLNKLWENPNLNSREQLYTFIEKNGVCISEDGDIILYKCVGPNFKDKHSGRFLNKPGRFLEMDRSKVDTNANAHCSFGFHVGSFDFVRGFGNDEDKYLIVKVNPKYVCSVPNDCNCQKMRVSKYKVLETVSRNSVIKLPNTKNVRKKRLAVV